MDTTAQLGLLPATQPDSVREIATRGRYAAEVQAVLGKLYENRRPGMGPDLISMFAPVYIISGMLALQNFPGVRLEYFLYTSIALIAYLSLFAGWSVGNRRVYKRFLAENVTFDDALGLIDHGGPELGRIRNWIPLPFAWFFVRSLPLTIPPRVRLVARNIDWYLDKPRPLIRVHWWSIAVYWVLGILLVVAKFFLSPKIDFAPSDKTPLVIIVASCSILAAILLSIYSHSLLREDLRITVVHDLLKPYLESLAAMGRQAELELPRDPQDDGDILNLQITGLDWAVYAVAVVAGIAYVILRLAHAAPAWAHLPVNILIAVVTWFVVAQLIAKGKQVEPVPRMHYWLFALYPAVAFAVGLVVTGLIEDHNYHVLELEFLYLLICIAGVLPVAARLLRIQREKLGEFVAGLAVWNILVFGIIGLIAVVLDYSGYILRPGA